jgi:hypothetical protein
VITDDDGLKLLFPNKETAALLIRISFEFSSPTSSVHPEHIKHLTCHFTWSDDSLPVSNVCVLCNFFLSSGGHNPYITEHKKPTITETIRLNRLHWFGHVQRMEENRIPKKVLYMTLETTRQRGRPRNRWPDDLRENGTLVGGKGWKEGVCNKEEWKKLLRTARNHRILHLAME